MTQESENVEVEELPAYYDALAGLLGQVRINQELMETILRNYKRRPQEFEEDAWRMLSYLTALGVRDKVARFLTSRFWAITRNINLDMMQSMISPQQTNPFMAGGIGFPPTSGTLAHQYPIPANPPEDQDMKMMRFMMMMKMMNQPQQSGGDSMQQMMQMMMMSGGRMGFTQEPIYDAGGKPLIDQMGNQVMRFTMQPSMQQPYQQQQGNQTYDIFKEIIKGQNEQRRASDDRYYKTLEKQREIEDEIREKENKALRRRLGMIEHERGSDRLVEDIERLKKLGLYPSGQPNNPESLEAVKIRTDLDRWKYERETDLVRWQQQQDLEARKWYKERELEEQRERRTESRLGVLGETLKDTLQTVVTPLLSSMATGVASGAQPTVQQAPDFSNYDNQSLMQQYQEVQQINERAESAKQMLEQEMRKRTAEVQKVNESATPTSYPPEPLPTGQQSSIDLGGMANLNFAASPIIEPEPTFDEYVHADELTGIIQPEKDTDYDVDY